MPDARAHQARKPVLPISRACRGILLSTVSAPGDAVNAGRPSSLDRAVVLVFTCSFDVPSRRVILPPSPILLRGLFLCCHHGQRQWPRSGGIEVILLRFASRPSLPLPSLNAAPKTDADFLLARHLQLTWADTRQTAASAKLGKSEAWYEHTNPSAMATVLLTCSPSLSESGSGPKSHEVPSWEGRIAPGGV